MILSPSQDEAKIRITKYLKSYDKTNNMFILEGSAGTGKSTVITHILGLPEFSNKEIVYSATTNKAVSVLKKYSEKKENYSYLTIHKLLNIKRKIDESGKELFETLLDDESNNLYKSKSIFHYDIIVIDESSMISCDLLTKLIKIKDKIKGKIIFLGDPAQLPPVNEANSLIFHTNDIPKFRLKEIMRYKGNIVDLCDKVRELVFNEDTRIKFKDYKCEKIKIFKDFDKSIAKYLAFMEKGYRPIYLVYTNRKCDLINSLVREKIFNATKNKYEEGEVILFNNYYKSLGGVAYYTSQQMIVEEVKSEKIDLSKMELKEIFKSKKINHEVDNGVKCDLCYNNVERDSLCGCKLCNECIKEWINDKFVCPVCFFSVSGNQIEIKNDFKLSHKINSLFSLFEGKVFTIYKLKLNNDDIIDTISEKDKANYEKFIEDIKESLKDIKSYIDKKYKRNKLFNGIMLKLWETFYQKNIDILANIVYGYCITTHKSQGSNYSSVFVDMENIITCNQNKRESYRCLYTAITRTSKHLNILM